MKTHNSPSQNLSLQTHRVRLISSCSQTAYEWSQSGGHHHEKITDTPHQEGQTPKANAEEAAALSSMQRRKKVQTQQRGPQPREEEGCSWMEEWRCTETQLLESQSEVWSHRVLSGQQSAQETLELHASVC